MRLTWKSRLAASGICSSGSHVFSVLSCHLRKYSFLPFRFRTLSILSIKYGVSSTLPCGWLVLSSFTFEVDVDGLSVTSLAGRFFLSEGSWYILNLFACIGVFSSLSSLHFRRNTGICLWVLWFVVWNSLHIPGTRLLMNCRPRSETSIRGDPYLVKTLPKLPLMLPVS